MDRVLVLYGGSSDERDVSLRSGAAVAHALESAGYETILFDPAHESEERFKEEVAKSDVVFPVLHGDGGEDGLIQTRLTQLGKPFVGAGVETSRLCFDKWRYRMAVQDMGVPIAEGALVTRDNFTNNPLIHSPFVLKPFDGGSSVDTFIIRDVENFDNSGILSAFDRHSEMLLEKLIEGQEITVGVLLGQALPIVEITPPDDAEFDYENKYNGATREVCPPEVISSAMQKKAQELAILIHQKLNIAGLSRTDMIVLPDQSGLYVLETNTMPGMTDQSLFPKAAAAAGYTMPQLVSRLVDAAMSKNV